MALALALALLEGIVRREEDMVTTEEMRGSHGWDWAVRVSKVRPF